MRIKKHGNKYHPSGLFNLVVNLLLFLKYFFQAFVYLAKPNDIQGVQNKTSWYQDIPENTENNNIDNIDNDEDKILIMIMIKYLK